MPGLLASCIVSVVCWLFASGLHCQLLLCAPRLCCAGLSMLAPEHLSLCCTSQRCANGFLLCALPACCLLYAAVLCCDLCCPVTCRFLAAFLACISRVTVLCVYLLCFIKCVLAAVCGACGGMHLLGLWVLVVAYVLAFCSLSFPLLLPSLAWYRPPGHAQSLGMLHASRLPGRRRASAAPTLMTSFERSMSRSWRRPGQQEQEASVARSRHSSRHPCSSSSSSSA